MMALMPVNCWAIASPNAMIWYLSPLQEHSAAQGDTSFSSSSSPLLFPSIFGSLSSWASRTESIGDSALDVDITSRSVCPLSDFFRFCFVFVPHFQASFALPAAMKRRRSSIVIPVPVDMYSSTCTVVISLLEWTRVQTRAPVCMSCICLCPNIETPLPNQYRYSNTGNWILDYNSQRACQGFQFPVQSSAVQSSECSAIISIACYRYMPNIILVANPIACRHHQSINRMTLCGFLLFGENARAIMSVRSTTDPQ